MKSLSQEEALKSILTKVKPLLREYIPVENCVGRTLATDLVSKIFSPPADSAAMDGYGVNNLNFSNDNIFGNNLCNFCNIYFSDNNLDILLL